MTRDDPPNVPGPIYGSLEWGERVLRHLHECLRDNPDSALTNGAQFVEGKAVQGHGALVLYLIYRHPWWPFPTGYRLQVAELAPTFVFDDWQPASLAYEIANEIGEPLDAQTSRWCRTTVVFGGGATSRFPVTTAGKAPVLAAASAD